MTKPETALSAVVERTFPLSEFGDDLHDYLQRGLRDVLYADLTALISEHYVSKEEAGYPKDFVEWIGDDCSPCYLEREDDDYGKWVVFKKGSMEHEAEFDTLDKLFNYWRENEQ